MLAEFADNWILVSVISAVVLLALGGLALYLRLRPKHEPTAGLGPSEDSVASALESRWTDRPHEEG